MMKNLGFMGLLKLLTIFATTFKPIEPTTAFFQDLQSPCPDVFQYDFDQTSQQLYGTIQIFPPDENFIHLKVELSLGNAVRGYQGSIEVPYTKAEVISVIMERKPLKYKVYFPAWNQIPPKITKISVNDRIFCYGPKVPFNSAPIITTIYLEHTLKLNVAPLSASPAFSNKPFQGNNNINNNNNFNNNNKNENWHFELDEQDIRIIPSTNNNNNNNWQNPFNFNPPVTQKINFDRPNTPSPTVPVNAAYPENPFFANDVNVNTPSAQAEKNGPSKVNVATNNRNVSNQFSTISTPNPPPQNKPQPVAQPITERAQTDIVPPVSSQITPSRTEADSLKRPNSDLCGVPAATNSLVVNGDAVRKGSFPWLVALYHANNEGLLYKCCASLVTNSHVVTAAHCVYRKKPEDIILRIGRSNIKEWIPDPDEKYMIAASVHVHPDYRPLSSNADIAVLKFRTAIEFSKFIRPICLWQGSTDLANVVNQQGIVVGWGKDENGVPRTAEPRQVTMPIVSQEQCLRAAYQFRDITSNTTFCAGSLNGKGPCNGDSGSGFIMKRGDRWVLRGIVSIALPSETNLCDLKNYIVFADASKYRKWLLDNIL